MADKAKIERLAEIQKEISKLAAEGVQIAEDEGVNFSLAQTPMAEGYGIGSLEYVPKSNPDNDGWNYTKQGWRASSSDMC